MTSLNGQIRPGVKLKNYTTFRIGGKADGFAEAEDTETLKRLMTIAEPKFILGMGSNILVSDEGFRGLVVAVRTLGLTFENGGFTAEAGVPLPHLAKAYIDGGFSGMEWATGIPGSVGGACVMNAGAFGGSVADVLESVDVLRNGAEISLKSGECGFAYRKSGFLPGDVILRARFKAVRSDKDKLLELRDRYTEFRKATQPKGWSAGSVFIAADKAAGWYIDMAGLKGLMCGGAMISSKHANFIINTSNATAENVTALIDIIKAQVKVKFGVTLKEEIRYVGDFGHK